MRANQYKKEQTRQILMFECVDTLARSLSHKASLRYLADVCEKSVDRKLTKQARSDLAISSLKVFKYVEFSIAHEMLLS